jgi:hypothetical protein
MVQDRGVMGGDAYFISALACYVTSAIAFVRFIKIGAGIDRHFLAVFQQWVARVETLFAQVVDTRNKSVDPQAADLANYFISFKKNVFSVD